MKPRIIALVAELVYAYDSGSYAARLVGSNPTEGTIIQNYTDKKWEFAPSSDRTSAIGRPVE